MKSMQCNRSLSMWGQNNRCSMGRTNSCLSYVRQQSHCSTFRKKQRGPPVLILFRSARSAAVGHKDTCSTDESNTKFSTSARHQFDYQRIRAHFKKGSKCTTNVLEQQNISEDFKNHLSKIWQARGNAHVGCIPELLQREALPFGSEQSSPHFVTCDQLGLGVSLLRRIINAERKSSQTFTNLMSEDGGERTL
jgi:hypothetical protein